MYALLKSFRDQTSSRQQYCRVVVTPRPLSVVGRPPPPTRSFARMIPRYVLPAHTRSSQTHHTDTTTVLHVQNSTLSLEKRFFERKKNHNKKMFCQIKQQRLFLAGFHFVTCSTDGTSF